MKFKIGDKVMAHPNCKSAFRGCIGVIVMCDRDEVLPYNEYNVYTIVTTKAFQLYVIEENNKENVKSDEHPYVVIRRRERQLEIWENALQKIAEKVRKLNVAGDIT